MTALLSVIAIYTIIITVTSKSTVKDFIYFNSGTTTKYQRYQLVSVTNIYNEGYQYKDDFWGSNKWNVGKPLTYLFERYPNGTVGTPSNGLRSSVFLGPIGQGGFEIRGDGRFTDFTIFNNGPNARPSSFSLKYDLNDAIFGFTFTNNHSSSASKIFQTSPFDELMRKYAIESITYSGSYPTSRLMATDDAFSALGINSINLTAFSPFEPLNTKTSSIPGVVFWFDIDNRNNTEDITMDFLFNWPDIIDLDIVSVNNDENGLIMNKLLNLGDPLYFTTGNMSFTTQECNVNNNKCATPLKGGLSFADSLYENWMSFINIPTGHEIPRKPTNPKIYGYYGWNAKDITIPRNSIYSFAAVFSWFFPIRTFNNNQQYLGNYYNNLYGSAEAVNHDIISKMPEIIQNIASWQRLWSMSMDAMYPDFLKDVYLNGPSFISRTSYLLEDDDGKGIWRQAESFSCFQIDPPHIHQYRALAYNLIFGEVLERGTLNMYSFGEIDNGMVSELFGGSCGGIGGRMGEPSGGPRGDDNSLYVLDMYSQFKWYKDGVEFVNLRYQYVKDAMNWMINQSIPHGYGLPYRLVNTNDEHGIIGDINTYNSMIYISALNAMKIMAKFYEPERDHYIRELEDALEYAYRNVTQFLWQENDGEGFYISFWCANGHYAPYGLQSDVLYGYLWSLILDLDKYWLLKTNRFVSHLEQEKIRNWTPYGLVFMTNRTTSGFNCDSSEKYDGGFKEFSKWRMNDIDASNLGAFQDFDTWEMATLDHASIAIYLLNNEEMLNDSLSIAGTGLNKYRELFHDQWDWRDTSSTYLDNDPEYSRPVVNSHYCRQLIHYAIMLAMNGQKLNVEPSTSQMTLKLQPIIKLNGNNGCLPVLIPQSTFLLCLNIKTKCFELNGLFGGVVIDNLLITNDAKQYNFTNVHITKDITTDLCYNTTFNTI